MGGMRVLEPGLFTTVQDLGRHGYAASGVPASGAADALSLVVGNRLLGNPDSAAGLEGTLVGPDVEFEHDSWVCLTGARCPAACIEGADGRRPLGWCVPARVRSKEVVRTGGTWRGARAYLCVSGGAAVARVLGSRSTLVSCGFGGHEGRALRKGDSIEGGLARHKPGNVPDELREWLQSILGRRTLRLVASLHTESFPPSAMEQLERSEYVVSEHSDRVGVRLSGPPVPLPAGSGESDSEPTVAGGVQVPGDGQPIILGVDRPTTGGYPLLACLIEADMPVLAMLCPREVVRFEFVALETARRLANEQQGKLDSLLKVVDHGADW